MFLTLNYHIINRTIHDTIAISEEAFAAQLCYLHTHDYTTLSLDQAIAIVDGKREAPPRSVLLTFDDGYADTVHVALPMLQTYGMQASLFVISAYVGQSNRWNPRACYDINHLTWDELRAWHKSGRDIGGHSHAHFCMTRLHAHELQEAVLVNKRLLEEKLGIPIRAFAYPYGRFNQAVQEVVRQHYEIAFAVEDGGWNARTYRFAINRLTVSPGWSSEEFATLLESLRANCAANL